MRSAIVGRAGVLAGALLVLALAGCTKEPSEFTANDQVPAEQATSEAATGEAAAPPTAVAGTWVVEGSDLAYDQAPEALPAGEVTITLENDSGLLHDVSFEGVQSGEPILEADGNSADTGTVTLEPGQYTYFCAVPGHREAGMEGTLTVR